MNIHNMIDDEGRILPQFIRDKGFEKILVFDIFSLIEAEWLEFAIDRLHLNEVLAISYNQEELVNSRTIPTDKESILKYVLNDNLNHTILTTSDYEFLIYFSQYRDYFLICGSLSFTHNAYPVSQETVKKCYFKNVELEALRDPFDPSHYFNLWRQYYGHDAI